MEKCWSSYSPARGKHCIGDDIERHSAHGIERRNCQPQDTEKVNMFRNPSADGQHCVNHANDLFSAAAAECLARLHCRSTSVAEHNSPPRAFPTAENGRSFTKLMTARNNMYEIPRLEFRQFTGLLQIRDL